MKPQKLIIKIKTGDFLLYETEKIVTYLVKKQEISYCMKPQKLLQEISYCMKPQKLLQSCRPT